MKKLLSLLLVLVMIVTLAACGGNNEATADNDTETTSFKAGFIFLHDENSTYDKNFMDAAKQACAELGVEYLQKVGIDESAACTTAAEELVDDGCGFVFADSFGHEGFLMEVAKNTPEVQFAHATGTNAHTAGLPNFANAFASIYEGRYLAGIAAGLKLNEMIEAGTITADEAKMGYVGAFTYAEVVSGYTSFYLGAKSVCPSVTMDVKFTGSWYDETAEKEAANALINGGCVLISQHADSMGAPTACETAGVPNISYNGSTEAACPNTFIVSSRINWVPYFKYAITAAMNGEAVAADWTGTIETGSVELTSLGAVATAEGTAEAIDAAKAAMAAGTLHVFDCSTWTVGGVELTEYMADVDSDAAFTPDTNVIADGYFNESAFRSAPYFDIQIDGINLLDVAY